MIRKNDRRIVGQKITGLDLNKFATGRGKDKTTAPCIILANGIRLYFNVQETEGSDYGVEITVNETGRTK